jgi:hypothetical protein
MKKLHLLLMALFCFSTIVSKAQGHSIQKEKPITKQKRTISSFEKVEVSGGGRLYFHYAPVTSLELSGPGACFESIKTEVVANTLYINSGGALDDGCEVKIYVGTPALNEIRLKGGGSLKVEEGFPAVDKFSCRIDGGGRVHMPSLQVDSLYASIDGGGALRVRVNSFLKGEISSGGVIRYYGSPVVESEISGGGLIKKK